MSTTAKALWVTLGVLAVMFVGCAGTVALAAHAVHRDGMVHVAVHEHGPGGEEIEIYLPATLIGAGLAIAPHVMPAEARAEMEAEIEAELGEIGPAVRQLLAELERQPDFTLVEVVERDERVEVVKRDGHLVVRVRSADADVDVQVPLGLVDRTLASFDL